MMALHQLEGEVLNISKQDAQGLSIDPNIFDDVKPQLINVSMTANSELEFFGWM